MTFRYWILFIDHAHIAGILCHLVKVITLYDQFILRLKANRCTLEHNILIFRY